jgi:hypothetical protein
LVKVLQDLWVLTDSGIVLFSRVFNQTINEQLFGGLMTALNTFAGELAKGGLSSFELSSIRFTIFKDKSLLFVANSSKKIKEKKVQDELKLIADKFKNKYSNVLNEWDSDVNIFLDFNNEIQDSLEDTIKKFQDAFW